MAVVTWDEVTEAVRARPDYVSRLEKGTQAEMALIVTFSDGDTVDIVNYTTASGRELVVYLGQGGAVTQIQVY